MIFLLIWVTPILTLVAVWAATDLPWYALGLMLLCWIAGLAAGLFDGDRPWAL